MSRVIYLQPVGLLYGDQAQKASQLGVAGLIAGRNIGYQGVIQRTRTSSEDGQFISYMDAAASTDQEIKEQLALIGNPRPSMGALSFSDPLIMGIVNTTPDSFSDGGDFYKAEHAISHGLMLAQDGADILDIGGESTRPGAQEISTEEELRRTLGVVESLSSRGMCVSIDSRKSQVMEEAISKGASVINDVSALRFDPRSPDIAAKAACPVILMHAKGSPETMQDNPSYAHVVLDVFDELSRLIENACNAGVKREHIIADPGIGFGKTCSHNLDLMACLTLFHGLGVPLLVGASRKRFLGEITGEKDPKKRVFASVAAALFAASQGVQILRVHDVLETVQALITIKNIQK